MNRLQEIAKQLVRDLENKVEAHPTTALYIDGVEYGCKMLLEAIKPEIELMLKEQAEIVKNDVCSIIASIILKQDFSLGLCNAIRGLQHDWVKLEDK